ncbi:unnamed protein product [Symbiodinium sp. CCMP2592]|nr:unnamed protein product [Symbiodinium sp. CCMP2592]
MSREARQAAEHAAKLTALQRLTHYLQMTTHQREAKPEFDEEELKGPKTMWRASYEGFSSTGASKKEAREATAAQVMHHLSEVGAVHEKEFASRKAFVAKKREEAGRCLLSGHWDAKTGSEKGNTLDGLCIDGSCKCFSRSRSPRRRPP